MNEHAVVDGDKDYFAEDAGAHAFNASFANFVAEQQKQFVSQYLSPESTHRFRHRGNWLHPGLPDLPDTELQQHSSSIETPFCSLIDNDLSIIQRNAAKLRESMHQQFATMLYSTVTAACAETGNTVDAQASGSLEQAILDMLEKIELNASRNGEVILPQLHAGPDAAVKLADALSAASPEFKVRFDEILRRKSKVAVAREADRKAKFANYGDEA
ncbi:MULTISPECIES: hypothetical protein [unclassified Caballeronia]|uniref:hypothetical protein n=1 Tax=unclassified Caballeronia TaxID=2646786 RepID=UPI0020279CFC|nr:MULTISPECIES: hypothetical protein [unclassified Caballeronia]